MTRRDNLPAEALFRKAFNEGPLGMAIIGLDDRFVEINPRLCAMLGYTQDEIRARTVADITYPEDRDSHFRLAHQLVCGAIPHYSLEKRYVKRNGEILWVNLSVSVVRTVEREPLYFLKMIEDITARKRTEIALQESEQRFRSALQALQEGFVLQSPEGAIQLCNQSAERILGLSASQVLGRTSLDPRWHAVREDGTLFPGEMHPAMVTLREGIPQQNVVMGVHKPDGRITWISINSVPLFHPDEANPYAAVCTFADISEQKRLEQQSASHIAQIRAANVELERQQQELIIANAKLKLIFETDALTGLKNRQALYDTLMQEFEYAVEDPSPLSLILLDVDDFKLYNDAFGHPAGDKLLQAIGTVLRENARSRDVVARWGGEEFAVFLNRVRPEDALLMAERFRSAIEQMPGMMRMVTASFGVATLLPGMAQFSRLVEEADKALHVAKARGKNCVIQAVPGHRECGAPLSA